MNELKIILNPLLHGVALDQHLKKLPEFYEYTYLITMGMFYGTIGLYCICQLLKTGLLLLYMFIRGWMFKSCFWNSLDLKFSTSNANLLLNFN